MNDNRYADTENLLRRTLREEAGEVYAGLTVDDVRQDALARRRRSLWRTAVIVAAAAAVVAGVPAAVMLRSGDQRGERPPALTTPTAVPSTAAPSPTDEPSFTPEDSELAKVERGADIAIPWMSEGVIHLPTGSSVKIPDPATGSWHAFTSYHGGWLLSGDGGVMQVDASGQLLLRMAQSGGGIAVSNEGTRAAFLADDTVRIGLVSGTREGENIVPVRSPEAQPIGFLSAERVVCNGHKGQVLVLDAMDDSSAALSGISRASASNQQTGLVAGTTVDYDGTAAVMSASTGKILWTKPGWVPAQFSPDGRYLAAYQSATGGEFETVAILDARTGHVIASTRTDGPPALPEIPTAWEDDRHLLIPYRDGQAWTVLRLGVDGRMNAATDTFGGSLADANLVFAARP